MKLIIFYFYFLNFVFSFICFNKSTSCEVNLDISKENLKEIIENKDNEQNINIKLVTKLTYRKIDQFLIDAYLYEITKTVF